MEKMVTYDAVYTVLRFLGLDKQLASHAICMESQCLVSVCYFEDYRRMVNTYVKPAYPNSFVEQ